MNRFLSQATTVLTRISKYLTILSAICIGAMMAINFIDVVGTKFFGVSLPCTLEFSEELMVFVTLLPIAYVALERGHINITLLYGHLSLWARRVTQVMQYAIATMVTGFITYRTFVEFKKTFVQNQLKSGIEHIPIWPSNLAVVVSFALLTVIWILFLLKTLRSDEVR